MKAQFPGFVRDEWRPYYIDNSEKTAPYRDLFGLGSTIDPGYAYDLAEFCADSIEIFEDRVDTLRSKPALAALSAAHTRVSRIQDSIVLYRHARDYFRAINRFTGSPKWGPKLIPVRFREGLAEFFYFGESEKPEARADLFSDVMLQSSIKRNVVSSEVIAAYLPKFPLRLGLRTTIIDDIDSTTEQKIDNKILYGALLNADVLYPLFFHNSRFLTVYIPISSRLSVDRVAVNEIPGVADVEPRREPLIFSSTSLDVYIRAPFNTLTVDNSPKSRLAFFANGRVSFFDGVSTFYDRLRLTNNRYGFYVAQLTAGFEINNRLRIGANVPIWTTNKDIFSNQQITIGVQIDPKFLTGN